MGYSFKNKWLPDAKQKIELSTKLDENITTQFMKVKPKDHHLKPHSHWLGVSDELQWLSAVAPNQFYCKFAMLYWPSVRIMKNMFWK